VPEAKRHDHEARLREAIACAIRGVEEGLGSPFGAVLVRGDEVLERTCNEVVARCDPTAHAEMIAIRRASRSLGTRKLEGCVAYTSCEPCPMCLAALAFAGVDAVYFAATGDEAAARGMAPPAAVLAMAPASAPLPITQLALPERHMPFEAWLARRPPSASPAKG
jgi:tRNA(Arg) A34 adenosine deaminase TadA